MQIKKEVRYTPEIPKQGIFFFVADIGGTNTNFGLLHQERTLPTLLVSLHLASNTITNIAETVVEVLDYIEKNYGIIPHHGCFGVAGIVAPNRESVQPTHLPFVVKKQKLLDLTPLISLTLINDFEAIAYGIDLAPDNFFLTIKTPEKKEGENHHTKVILGAGTGLGKGIVMWDRLLKRYVPHPSEGGHGDCSFQTADEITLADHIRSKLNRNHTQPVSWEDVLSGHGLQTIYQFLGATKEYTPTPYVKKIAASNYNPPLISQYRQEDPQCSDTFAIFTQFYARCAKNFALDNLALGGVYIAGGIAAKNAKIFEEATFLDEFYKNRKFAHVLKEIPLYVITNYNINLYGAAACASLGQRMP